MSPMHSLLRLVAILALVAFTQAANASDVEADYAAWQSVQRQTPSRDKGTRTKEDTEQFWRDKAVELERLSREFIVRHPRDPRRWEVGLRTVQISRWRDYENDAARDAAAARDEKFLQELVASSEARADLVEQAHSLLTQRALDAATQRHRSGQRINPSEIEQQVDQFAARYPNSRAREMLERRYLELLGEIDSAASEARMHRLAGDATNPAVAEMAETMLHKASFRGKMIEMKFTAADGRDVDLAALRGKVVLVDFWATWCGPCMAEMPHIKELYRKYQHAGLEVIGISLDGGGITKGIQSGVKAKDHFLAFLEREQMPWPQHYDNLGWKNEFAQKFRIKSIPALFLIGRDGRVISAEARGESLEPQIRKALGL